MRVEVRPAASVRVICVPHAGASASAFRTWPVDLSSDIEVLAVQLPGREDRWHEPALSSMPLVIGPLVDTLAECTDRPYALFGHSMGALIVFELARAARARGLRSPAHVFVSACAAPHRPGVRRALSGLSDADLLAELVRLTGPPDAAMQNTEFLELMLPTLRADCSLCATYDWQPAPPLDCPITAFGGRHDPAVPRTDLEAWAGHTAGDFEVRTFPGDHFYFDAARPSGRRALLQAIERRLLVGPPGSTPT